MSTDAQGVKNFLSKLFKVKYLLRVFKYIMSYYAKKLSLHRLLGDLWRSHQWVWLREDPSSEFQQLFFDM